MRQAYAAYKIGLVILLLGLLPAAALAAPITLTMVQTTQAGQVGDVLTYGGTITNTSTSTVWVNGDDITIITFDQIAYDDSLFVANVIFSPNQPLVPDGFIGPVDWFTVTIPAGTAAGSYQGTIRVHGGDTGGSDDVLESTTFYVQVQDAAVPEPATFGLLALSAGLLAFRLRRRTVSR